MTSPFKALLLAGTAAIGALAFSQPAQARDFRCPSTPIETERSLGAELLSRLALIPPGEDCAPEPPPPQTPPSDPNPGDTCRILVPDAVVTALTGPPSARKPCLYTP